MFAVYEVVPDILDTKGLYQCKIQEHLVLAKRVLFGG